MSIDLTALEVAKYLRDFIEGTGGAWDWDDFTSVSNNDPDLEVIRREATLIDLPVTDMEPLRERRVESLARD